MLNIKSKIKKKNKGMVLIFAVIIMATMVIAVLALLRSNDTSNSLTTNMLLKEGALITGNNGLEAAIATLNSLSTQQLRNNDPSKGYYATGQTTLNLKTGVVWDGNGNGVKAKQLEYDDLGNKASFIIHRMCETAGEVETSGCVTNLQVGGNDLSSKGGSGLTPLAGKVSVYYRITVKVIGPKNTESYLQAMVYR